MTLEKYNNYIKSASKQLAPQLRCGASCLLALIAVLSNQERSASKQLAPGAPYTRSQPALS
jgi:DNA-binding transcriptional MocR family regulator